MKLEFFNTICSNIEFQNIPIFKCCFVLLMYQGEYKQDVVGQVNPPKFDMCEDMSNLTYLNEGSVLFNLAARYVERLIYVSLKTLNEMNDLYLKIEANIIMTMS